MIKILEGLGEVELVDHMGGDLSVVNSARVSYNKRKKEIDSKDERLIKYLWKNHHTSPFRHSTLQFRVLAPIFVLRQWMKHQVGCAWNERSGRYTEFENESYQPRFLFEDDRSIKQGSAEEQIKDSATMALLNDSLSDSFDNYSVLLKCGVSREQARAVLPVGMLSECYWTCSLHALMHFLTLRLDSHTQYELRLFAREIHSLVKGIPSFSSTLGVWREEFLKDRAIDSIIKDL